MTTGGHDVSRPSAGRDLPSRLREALSTAGFTHAGVVDLLGAEAHTALGRNETVPALRRTAGGSALETLVRLFLLQASVTRRAADAALPGLVDAMAVEGLLTVSVGEVAARLDVRPYAVDDETGGKDLWVVSDLTPGLDAAPYRTSGDHVLGISSASTSLAQLTVRHPVDSALDLGTGCGVQALHLATHSRRVVATDVNPRALRVAGLNARLNGVADRVDLRAGSLFEPVSADRFDLVTTNPPFVVSPGTGERLVYRDSGMPRDSVVERIVRGLPARLTPGGWGQVLANWIISADRPWQERLGDWLSDEVDALVVQREVLDPAAYVELWLRDAGLTPDYAQRYDTWLSWLADQGVAGIGFGWISVHRTDPGPGAARHDLVEWPWEVEQPISPTVTAWGEAVATDRRLADADLLAAHPLVRDDVRQETFGPPGAADPETIVLRQQRGLRRARTVDTVEAGFVGAADGDLSTVDLLGALATLLDRDPTVLAATYLPVVRELLGEGFLTLRR